MDKDSSDLHNQRYQVLAQSIHTFHAQRCNGSQTAINRPVIRDRKWHRHQFYHNDVSAAKVFIVLKDRV